MPPRRRSSHRLQRRNPKGFQAWPISKELSLGTLVNNVAVKVAVITFTDGIYAISADLVMAIHTQVSGEGPLQFGLAHGDLTVTEITEALIAAPVSRSDLVQMERARRPVRSAGLFQGLNIDEIWENGEKVRIPLKFTITQSNSLSLWVVNRSNATLTVGNAVVELNGVLYGRWL